MKGFKKLALVAAISAAPFAQAELTSIDDAALSDMTGQAGISIDLSAQVSIGSVDYTDTDGVTGGAGAGTLGINTIVLGGNGGGALDDIKIDIDVDAAGGLIIHLGATNTADVLSGGTQKVDFGLSVGDVTLNNTAVLASGITIGGNLGPVDVVIGNTGNIDVDAYFEVTSGSLDLDVLGLGITNLTIGDDNGPLLTDTTYSAGIVAAQNIAAADLATYKTAAGDASDAAWLDDAGTPAGQDANGNTQAEARTLAEDATTEAVVRAGAVAGVSNMAYVGMTISTVTTGYLSTSTFQGVEVANALNINITGMNMDIGMDLSMGETVTRDPGTGAITSTAPRSLGSVAINDLNLTGTQLTIYGH